MITSSLSGGRHFISSRSALVIIAVWNQLMVYLPRIVRFWQLNKDLSRALLGHWIKICCWLHYIVVIIFTSHVMTSVMYMYMYYSVVLTWCCRSRARCQSCVSVLFDDCTVHVDVHLQVEVLRSVVGRRRAQCLHDARAADLPALFTAL